MGVLDEAMNRQSDDGARARRLEDFHREFGSGYITADVAPGYSQLLAEFLPRIPANAGTKAVWVEYVDGAPFVFDAPQELGAYQGQYLEGIFAGIRGRAEHAKRAAARREEVVRLNATYRPARYLQISFSTGGDGVYTFSFARTDQSAWFAAKSIPHNVEWWEHDYLAEDATNAFAAYLLKN